MTLKVNTIPDWTQGELDAQIALGNFPPGTLLGDITLPSDWNQIQPLLDLKYDANNPAGYVDAAGAAAAAPVQSVAGKTGIVTLNASDIAALTASRALVTNASGFMSAATTTATEIGFVSGVTANIQTQINALAAAGYVVGPASSTDNAIARFDLATGKVIQNSVVTIADTTGIIAGTDGIVLNGVASSIYAQGKLVYDTDNESLTFYNNDSNVALQIGQEAWIRVRNDTGSTIANGVPVYISGTHASGLPQIAPAQANAAATVICAGLATESIANNTIGYVTSIGLVRNMDTSAFAAGATVFVSAAAPGALTSTAPSAPNYRFRVGIVTRSNATTGTVHVTPSTGALGNGTANQVFGMNSAGTAQEVKTLGSTTSIVAVNAANSITFTRAALTGDITAPSNSNATTLATVNSNVGTFGSSTSIPTFTVNAKGLITAASGNVVIAPAGTLTGTTLASGVTASSLTSLGAQAQDLNLNSHKLTNVTDPTSAQDAATKAYVDTAVTGLLDYRGSYNASTNLFPSTGGSGLLGAVLKGDFWICSVPGTLGGESVTAGDLIIAIVDTPGQTSSNWDLIEHNIGSYVSSVSGTTNRITSTGGSTPQIDISASYVGQASITTLGTVGTGTWNATAITVPYGGTGVATLTGLAKGNGTSAFTAATAGTDYSAGTSALTTGILKSTTTTGALTIAVAGDFPTLNQNTTGSAATLTTGRTIAITGDLAYTSGSFNGSGNVTGTGTLATVNSNVGSFGSATQVGTFTVNAKGLTTAAANVTVTPAVGSITGLGTGVATWLSTPSSANLRTVVTDENGTGVLLFDSNTAATLNQPNIVGVTTNSNAAAGSVGEEISASVLISAAVSLSTGTTANITSISLTAGDWDVDGSVVITSSGNSTRYIGAINTTSATLPAEPYIGGITQLNMVSGANGNNILAVSNKRLSLAGTTTVYLLASHTFTTGTAGGAGGIRARRIR